jgi:hypothetical protein
MGEPLVPIAERDELAKRWIAIGFLKILNPLR